MVLFPANHIRVGKFIYNNYRQALQIVEEGKRALDIYARELEIGPAEYESYLEQERAYLRSLMAEPPEVALRVQYMEALQKLEDARYVLRALNAHLGNSLRICRVKDQAAVESYKTLDYQIIHKGITRTQIANIKREYLAAQARVASAEESVTRVEEMLEVDSRWTPDTPEYVQLATELKERKYRRALDNLERLVVQRLFELSKLGMNGIGALLVIHLMSGPLLI